MSIYNPQYMKILGSGKQVNKHTIIKTDQPIIANMLIQKMSESENIQAGYTLIQFIQDIPQEIMDRVNNELEIPFVENDEGYVIDIFDEIHIYSRTERGLFYGCMSLLGLMKEHYIDQLFAYDYPTCSERGLKVYLPSEQNIDYFKQLIDMLCHYKYNTVMIEVGGAMEYKKHPEINSGWIDYCKEMSEYSGKTKEIQDHTFSWYKNSIHVENGEGGFLSQIRVKELVDYCKQRMLKVIPEVPSLSHCDYLMLNHREIAERPEDPYPDTYCPSNPKSYELLFDILDEVIEVFNPAVINIGHDEYYSIGLCEKCKGKKAEDIFADDIIKIYNYLGKQGIRTMIWAEKLLKDVYITDAGPFGGAEMKMYQPAFRMNTGKFTGNIIPATYKAIDLIPQDIEILHWSWGHGEHLDHQFVERNMNITFGNFEGEQFPDWNRRIGAGIKGAIISNWSTLSEMILQRNGILFTMVFSYSMLWRNDYKEDNYAEVRDSALQELFNYKNGVTGSEYIEIIHSTDYKEKYTGFVDGVFVNEDKNRIGDYVIQYEDDTRVMIPIIYGENISSLDVSWERSKSETAPVYKIDNRLVEVSLTTLPLQIMESTYYKYVFKNPFPDKKIQGYSVQCKTNKQCSVMIQSIRTLK